MLVRSNNVDGLNAVAARMLQTKYAHGTVRGSTPREGAFFFFFY